LPRENTLYSKQAWSAHGTRSFFAEYQERVKGYHQTLAYQKAMNKRKVWVEPLFAEAKDWHGMRRFRLRRLWRVNCEALVTATGQNLKRLLQKRGWGRRPFPVEAVATVPPLNGQADERPRHDLLKSYRPGVAVASLVYCGIIGTFFKAQTSWFSLVIMADFTFNCTFYSPISCSFSSVSPSSKGSYEQPSSYILCKLSKEFFNRLGRFLRHIALLF